jgi:hypothetical protein
LLASLLPLLVQSKLAVNHNETSMADAGDPAPAGRAVA